MCKIETLEDFNKLTNTQIKELTKNVSYTYKDVDSGNGYLFTNTKSGKTLWCPKTVSGMSGADLMDFMIIRVGQLDD